MNTQCAIHGAFQGDYCVACYPDGRAPAAIVCQVADHPGCVNGFVFFGTLEVGPCAICRPDDPSAVWNDAWGPRE